MSSTGIATVGIIPVVWEVTVLVEAMGRKGDSLGLNLTVDAVPVLIVASCSSLSGGVSMTKLRACEDFEEG